MKKINELKLNRSLLDKDFEGYKLSLSPVPVYREEIPDGVHVVQPGEDQFSFLHQRLFSLHNHLVADPWHKGSVYFLDASRKIRRSWIGQSGRLEKTVEVMELPQAGESRLEKYNASLSFSSPDVCVVSDGAGTLFVVDTSNRSAGDVTTWKLLHRCQPIGDDVGFLVCDSRVASDQLTKVVHCVVQRVSPVTSADIPPNRKTPGYETVLTWIIMSEEIDGDWTLRTDELRGSGAVDYLALEPKGSGVYVVSGAPFESSKACDEAKINDDLTAAEEDAIDFEWQQSYEDVKIWLDLPAGEVSKSDVQVSAKSSDLEVAVRSEILLKGKLHGAIDPALTTWAINDKKIEISLQKYLEGSMWPSFIESDKKGKEIPNLAIIDEVNAQLAHLTSEKEEAAGPVMNAMEECDAPEGESRMLMRFARDSLLCTNKVYLGCQQWLMSIRLEPDNVPSFCVRNDVDGCVWLPNSPDTATGDWKVDHVGTLLAFGYVQASKTNRKFSIAPSDLSYVAIVDVTGHVIVYRKGVAVNTNLRNRKTGRHLKEIAVQQMVNLHTVKPILGAVATDLHLFVLTSDALHLLHTIT